MLKVSRFLAVAFGASLAVASLTIIWFVRLVKMFQAKAGANVAVDVALLTHSPLYWLIVALILTVAAVVCRYWVFV